MALRPPQGPGVALSRELSRFLYGTGFFLLHGQLEAGEPSAPIEIRSARRQYPFLPCRIWKTSCFITEQKKARR
jgi:hypothetical protein